MDEIIKTLREARNRRPRPGRDSKILADWNGMMIAALAIASRVFDEPAWYDRAAVAMDFLLPALRMPDGGLFHRYCDHDVAIPGFADDYAWMIRALIELYETSFSPRWLEGAIPLDEYLEIHFADRRNGGYFTAADNGEDLLVRQQEIHDSAQPPANAVMLKNLVLLGHLTGNSRYDERAGRLAAAYAGRVEAFPSASCGYLTGLDHHLGPATDIVLAGDPEDPLHREMIREINRLYLPSATVHRKSAGPDAAQLGILAPFTTAIPVPAGNVTAYVCQGHTCRSPVQTRESLREILSEKKGD